MSATQQASQDLAHIHGGQDFWLLYPQTQGHRTFNDVIHALYYLPDNYKLIVITQDPTFEMSIPEHRDIMKRVQFETGAQVPDEDSPFSIANAFLYDGSDTDAPQAPAILVTSGTTEPMQQNEWNGFTVCAGKPEALASALLRVARSYAVGAF